MAFSQLQLADVAGDRGAAGRGHHAKGAAVPGRGGRVADLFHGAAHAGPHRSVGELCPGLLQSVLSQSQTVFHAADGQLLVGDELILFRLGIGGAVRLRRPFRFRRLPAAAAFHAPEGIVGHGQEIASVHPPDGKQLALRRVPFPELQQSDLARGYPPVDLAAAEQGGFPTQVGKGLLLAAVALIGLGQTLFRRRLIRLGFRRRRRGLPGDDVLIGHELLPGDGQRAFAGADLQLPLLHFQLQAAGVIAKQGVAPVHLVPCRHVDLLHLLRFLQEEALLRRLGDNAAGGGIGQHPAAVGVAHPLHVSFVVAVAQAGQAQHQSRDDQRQDDDEDYPLYPLFPFVFAHCGCASVCSGKAALCSMISPSTMCSIRRARLPTPPSWVMTTTVTPSALSCSNRSSTAAPDF